MLCHNILLHEITATRLDKLKSLYGCTHFFILNVSTEKCVDQEFLPELELQQIYFSIIAFKFQKEPTAKQKERADVAKAKKENAAKGKKE